MHQKTKKIFYCVLGCFFLLAFLGCGQQRDRAKEKVVKRAIPAKPSAQRKTEKTDKQPRSSANAAEKTAMQASTIRPPYNPDGKIDPFQPLFKKDESTPDEGTPKKKRVERPRTPLERLELGQLKLVAIVFSDDMKKALVEEASGKGYVVELGTSIGRERGKVVDILKDRIVIRQDVEDDFGDQVVKQKELKLQKPPGE